MNLRYGEELRQQRSALCEVDQGLAHVRLKIDAENRARRSIGRAYPHVGFE